jgi:hypothetical protein
MNKTQFDKEFAKIIRVRDTSGMCMLAATFLWAGVWLCTPLQRLDVGTSLIILIVWEALAWIVGFALWLMWTSPSAQEGEQ